MGHFGVDKTLDILKEKFCWPHMRKDVQRHCSRCISCLKAKSRTMPHANAPWEDIRMDFVPPRWSEVMTWQQAII